MSIELKPFAKGIDHYKIKTYLFGSDDNNVDLFNDTINCISPGGEIISFAHCDKIITCTIKWMSNSTDGISQQFQVMWNDTLCNFNEKITSVICLPISAVNVKLSSHSIPEWFCIVVGFSSGNVKFYNEDGEILFSQTFYNGSVLKIRCQSHQPAKNNPPTIEQPEELSILYCDVICTIDGTLLVNCLRSCKNQMAKIQGNCANSIICPSLAYKKWAFDSQSKINDAAVGGRYDITSFQHIVAANICKSFSGDKQNTLPKITQIIAAGKEPYLAFHFNIDGQPQLTFGNITKAIASKIKSSISQSLPTWLTHNLSLNESLYSQELPEQLGCRFKLNDENREAFKIELSPQLSVGVISDNLDKVTLFEVNAGGIIRTWDDCKDVQFGWIVVSENKSSSSKQALFLVMYLPNQESLEVWAMQNYEKVSALKVSKNGRLFYTNFGLLGTLSTSRANIYNANYRCYFIDETEIIQEISIPFHCIDGNLNSELTRDMHLLRTFKSLCKNENINDEKLCEEVIVLANKLSTDKVRQQAFEYIKTSKHMTQNAFVHYLKRFKEIIEKEDSSEPLKRETWLKTIDCNLKLVIYLSFLFNFQEKHCCLPINTSSADDKTQELCKTLRISDQDLDKIISLLPIEPQRKIVVMFQDEMKLSYTKLTELITCFDVSGEHIILKRDMNVDDLCKRMFETIMHADGDIREWNLAWVTSGIKLSDMIYLAVQYWLAKPLTLTVVTEMINFYRVIDTICNTSDGIIEKKFDWKTTQDQFSHSSNTFACLTGAIICKNIASIKKTVKVDAEWECISSEDYQWNLLIERLEQVCHLNTTLKYQSVESAATLFCITYNYLPITLVDLLKKGRGGVSTLVAKWLASIGINPSLINDDYLMDINNKMCDPPKENKVIMGVQEGIAINTETALEANVLSTVEKETLDALKRLRSCFPYSLDSNTLLSNINWEYSSVWQNCVADLRPLKAALKVAENISCSHIKQSITSLVWSTYLSNVFQSAVRLIHRLGKVPKEKLCIQDVGMPDRCIAQFFEICECFIEIIIKASLLVEEDELAEIKHDLFWENWKTNNQHELTLVQKALHQPNPDQDMLFFLHQCARTFHILSKFSLHINKPFNNLFDCNINEIDFCSLNHQNFKNEEQPRFKIKKGRIDFLTTSISSAIGLIQKDCEDGHCEFESKEYLFWISKIFQLAIDWQLPLDELRIHQVVSLYAKGHDRLAEEVVPTINNKDNLVKFLLNIIKHRLKYELTVNDLDFHDKIVHFSPEIILWLNTSVTIEVEKSLLKEILELVQTVITLLPENSDQYEFVTNLMDSLNSLININRQEK
ncbi:rab3 GTPase-activating protein non-catalytic subunit [Adelges cooleyi]|uniref:rab3 GTPase-activating protein non-catalytic subunit n=1 Tax=Adelges cooleyi TaxID=133065 RepID=UPI0021803D47|nr:rab3 GTPase-activating protein non-catalytic subunit [Adelges cooleyi]